MINKINILLCTKVFSKVSFSGGGESIPTKTQQLPSPPKGARGEGREDSEETERQRERERESNQGFIQGRGVGKMSRST